jgi:hypothetical protein
MSTPAEYSLRLEPTTWKSANLVYSEAGYQLVLELERSGLPEVDWVGCESELRSWTTPPGEPVSEVKHREILARLSTWAEQERLRIRFFPCKDMETLIAEQVAAGWRVERMPDGTTVLHRPEHDTQSRDSSDSGRLWSWMANLFKSGPGAA